MVRQHDRSLVGRYSMALLAPAIVAGVMQLTWPFFEQSPGALFLLAIMFCAWSGGLGPGLLSVFISLLIADYFFIAPYFALWPVRGGDLVYLVTLAIVGPGFSVLSELMHRARRRAEITFEELTQQEAHSRKVAQVLDRANVLVCDLNDQITLWNTGATQLYGWTKEDAVGQVSHHLLQTRFPIPLDEIKRELLRAGQWEGELTRTTKDGQQIMVASQWVLHYDEQGQSDGSLEVNTDITDRKRVEKALSRTQDQMTAVVSSAMDAIIMIDREQRILLFNPAAEKMFRCAADEAIGQTIDRFIPERFRPTHAAHIRSFGQSSIMTRPMARARAIYGRRSDGEEFALEASISQVESSEEKLYTVIMHDITERNQIEERLKVLAVDLERRNRELQDFASVASHDLQEPLRKIQTFADELVVNSAEIGDENRETLQRIQKAAGRMQGLINDLLALSRVTSQARPSSPVDLNDLVREVLIDLELRIKETGGRVEVGDIPTIEAEPSQMRQLVQNLISNALKFHSPGRAPMVKVHGELLHGDQPPPGNGHAPAPTLCQITVEDNGIGFDEKYVDRIFAMFQRLHGRSQYEGTGIGLAICRKIVEHHGGQITARSVPGQGSTFIVTMPTKQNKEKT